MNYQPVKSSNITAVGYDAENQKLGVRFNNGTSWIYSGVPAYVHVQMLTGRKPGEKLDPGARGHHSIGSAFTKLVRGKFAGEKEKAS